MTTTLRPHRANWPKLAPSTRRRYAFVPIVQTAVFKFETHGSQSQSGEATLLAQGYEALAMMSAAAKSVKPPKTNEVKRHGYWQSERSGGHSAFVDVSATPPMPAIAHPVVVIDTVVLVDKAPLSTVSAVETQTPVPVKPRRRRGKGRKS